MERFYNKYKDEFDALEATPLTDRQTFVHCSASRNRTSLVLRLSMLAVAAAVLLFVVYKLPLSDSEGSAVGQYMAGLRTGVQPLYDDMLRMESESDLCESLGLSSVVSTLMESSEHYVSELYAVDDVQAARCYCDGQLDRIRELYRKCTLYYSFDEKCKSL